MKTLLVLRHAKSSWDRSDVDDHERPLNARGERDALRMGQFVRKKRLTVERIISSDALRARLTAQAMADAIGYRGEILLDPRLYLASAVDILAVLRRALDPNVATVMIVGHNPGLEDLVTQLTREPDGLTTAALAQIALQIDRWADLRASTRGTLVGLWRPKELE